MYVCDYYSISHYRGVPGSFGELRPLAHGRLLVPATLGLTSRGQGARLGPLGWACARLWAGLAEVRDACEVLARFFRGH